MGTRFKSRAKNVASYIGYEEIVAHKGPQQGRKVTNIWHTLTEVPFYACNAHDIQRNIIRIESPSASQFPSRCRTADQDCESSPMTENSHYWL